MTLTLNQFIQDHLNELGKNLRAMFLQVRIHNGHFEWVEEYEAAAPEMVLCTYEIPANGKFQEYCEAINPAPSEWRLQDIPVPDSLGGSDPLSGIPYFQIGIIWFQDGTWSEIGVVFSDERGQDHLGWIHHGAAPTFPNHW